MYHYTKTIENTVLVSTEECCVAFSRLQYYGDSTVLNGLLLEEVQLQLLWEGLQGDPPQAHHDAPHVGVNLNNRKQREFSN